MNNKSLNICVNMDMYLRSIPRRLTTMMTIPRQWTYHFQKPISKSLKKRTLYHAQRRSQSLT